jgi:hypothetical protein
MDNESIEARGMETKKMWRYHEVSHFHSHTHSAHTHTHSTFLSLSRSVDKGRSYHLAYDE